MVRWAAAVLATLLSGCSDSGGTAIPEDADFVPFDVLDQAFGDFRISNQWSGGEARRVVRSQAEWEEVYFEVTGSPSPPAIDFSDRSIVFVAMGGRQSTGYDVVFEEIRKASAGRLYVIYREVSPGTGCGVQPQPTSPVAAALTIRDYSTVTFIIKQITDLCTQK